ncbi:threonine/serine dehydratase [Sporosarcina siberiensis]|uniref:Threonine/serine dehydratase n=1 Tax=Sporosarcina siberiensis TaxID=1365606 RepID=A0ABW4SEE7_9BACL
MTIDINLEGVLEARERIKKHVIRTPLLRIPALDSILNCQVYLKPENLQHTGSFKLRGAFNSLLALSDEEKECGVVCSSSGNHAQGIAWAAKELGISAKIVMPENCNPVKLNNVQSFGAEVLLIGTVSSVRDKAVKEIVENEGRTEIHPYANKFVKEGQGTIALEIFEDEPDIDMIVAPIGGGGLISGVSVAAKSLKPEVKVIGIEPSGASRYSKSLSANKPIKLDKTDTIADGTRTDQADLNNFEIIREYVDEVNSVDDDEIKEAIRLMVKKGKMVIEPSSAMVIAAFMRKNNGATKEKKVCYVLSGGNNDIEFLANLLIGK